LRQIWLRQWLCAVLRHDLILGVGIGVRNDADQLPREMEACEGRQLIACVTAELRTVLNPDLFLVVIPAHPFASVFIHDYRVGLP